MEVKKMYFGVGQERGNEVDSENAFRYAMERIAHGTPEEQREFIEWFYSGNWVQGDKFEQQ